MLEGINSTLADRMAENVGLAITRSMNPVAASMDRFIVAATRNQLDGVNRIVGRFLEQMNASLGSNFDSLGATMDLINTHQLQAAQQAVDTLRPAGGIVEDAQDLRHLTDETLSRFDAYVAELNATRTRDEDFERRSAELLLRMEKQNQSLANLIAGLQQKVDALSDPKAQADTAAALSEIRGITSTLSENVHSISNTLTALAEEV